MAYVDKCCGVCGKYIDLQEVGVRWSNVLNDTVSIYKRFEMGNVCSACLKAKVKNIHVKELKLSVYKRAEDIAYSKKHVKWFDRDGNKVYTTNGRIYYADDVLDKQNRDMCVGEPRPQWYNVYTQHDSEFNGGVNAKCKFKLRRLLRKLGVRGNVKHLIK